MIRADVPSTTKARPLGSLARRPWSLTLPALLLGVFVSSCDLLPATTPPDPAGSATSIAQTVAAYFTQSAVPSLTAAPLPTDTPAPTDLPATPAASETAAPSATPVAPTATQPLPPTALPCDRASFVGDVSIPDGMILAPGTAFTKIWRLRNAGSCTWTSGYAVVQVSGERMGGPAAFPIPGNVPPGGTLDIRVDLRAPSQTGSFQGNWQLRNAAGVLFGIGERGTDAFFVRIGVAATPTIDPAAWRAEYFVGRALQGNPLLVRNDRELNFDWKRAAPAPGLPADDFSVRWSRSLGFEAAAYRFHVLVDDGARLWIDGQLAIDAWTDGAVRELAATQTLSAGNHTLRLEYFENQGDARIQVWWEKLAATSSPTSSLTSSPTATPTSSKTATPVPSATPTATFTVSPSATPSPTATSTLTATPSPTPSATFTLTPSPTLTPTETHTPTLASTDTPTPLPPPTDTPTATSMPSETPSPTATPSESPTPTSTLPAPEHLLIVQVFSGDGITVPLDAAWVEILNPTQGEINLRPYKIGDEETLGGDEGMLRFPQGSRVGPGQSLLVAVRATDFLARYGFKPNFEMLGSDPDVPDLAPYPSWAAGAFAPSNPGDELLLLGSADGAIDVVVWGSGRYAGVRPHPGVPVGHSLQRVPPTQDTDDCSLDFIDQPTPRPGASTAFAEMAAAEPAMALKAAPESLPASCPADSCCIYWFGTSEAGPRRRC